MKIIDERELFDRNFKIYGTVDEPLFLAKDIAKMIGHSDPSTMMRMVDEEEKHVVTMFVSGQNRKVLMAKEDGLYEILMKSDKPIAKEFKKQVKIILKEIRKNGGYISTNESESDEDIIARALILAQRTIDRKDKMIKSLENEIVESQPMIAIAEAVTESEDNWDMGLFAKVLGVMGKNNLFKYLRDNKIFMDNNEPYATHIKYFKAIPVTKYNKFGSIVVPKTLIKPEGIKYIVSRLMKDGYIVLKSYSQILDELGE
jgi:prophage antirepressor-like protein